MSTTPSSPLNERTGGQWWTTDEEMTIAPVASTRAGGQQVLQAVGATSDEATYLFDVFLDKAIQGDLTRGLIDFPGNVRRIASGEILRPEVCVVREAPAFAALDSGSGPGNWFHNILLARAAMQIAIDKAQTTGIAMSALRIPLVIPTAQMQQAIDASMVGMAMTQCYPMVAPFGGYTPELGNAPVAYGVPAGTHEPVIVDMSLTTTSSSGVKMAALRGLPVPEGFILDERGNPTTDASEYPALGHAWHGRQRARGTLTSLGSGHKGYALVFIVGLLTSVLTDTSYPWDATEVTGGTPTGPDEHYGSLLIAIDPTALGLDVDTLASRVDGFIDHVKDAPKRGRRVRDPLSRREVAAAQARAQGARRLLSAPTSLRGVPEADG